MGVIVFLGVMEGSGVESNGANPLIGCGDQEDASNGMVGGICSSVIGRSGSQWQSMGAVVKVGKMLRILLCQSAKV